MDLYYFALERLASAIKEAAVAVDECRHYLDDLSDDEMEGKKQAHYHALDGIRADMEDRVCTARLLQETTDLEDDE